MKSTVEQLSGAERKALAHFYDTAAYTAFKKLCELEISGLGQDALIAPDMERKEYLHGRAAMASDFPKLIQELYKNSNQKG